MLRNFHAMVLACIGAASVTACQQQAPPPAAAEQAFSAENRRVARFLSLGGSALPEDDDASPLERAVLCRHLVEGLRSRIESAGGLPSDVAKGFGMVRDVYEQRIRVAAGGRPVPTGEGLAEDMDEAERSRRALACVERLQPSG